MSLPDDSNSFPPVVLPDVSWTIIRVGDRPGDLYAKTMFGKWTEIRTGKHIHDTELTALANEIVYLWTSGKRVTQRRGFVEFIDPAHTAPVHLAGTPDHRLAEVQKLHVRTGRPNINGCSCGLIICPTLQALETAGPTNPLPAPVFEYRLAYLDGDLIHPGSTVRGPEEHAVGVWDARRDPANESTYGPDIKLQRRPLVEWEDFRVPTAEDLGETPVTA